MVSSAAMAGGLALGSRQFSIAASMGQSAGRQFTAQEIIDLVLREAGLSPINDTVDTIKAGRADQVVTGIVTTMFPTISVIEETARRNANFIIAHEPCFYNHRDDPAWVKNCSVRKQKELLIDKYQIAIWRFHDYCHAMKPDTITYGVVMKAGWLPYFRPGERILTISPLSLEQLARHLKESLGIAHVRIIGSPNQQCSRIALLPGAWGGQLQVSVTETERPDVLIVGEATEWETVEYIRDEQSLGGKTALLVLGHAVSEEPGMEWFVEWLQPRLPEIKVTHVASGDAFTWL